MTLFKPGQDVRITQIMNGKIEEIWGKVLRFENDLLTVTLNHGNNNPVTFNLHSVGLHSVEVMQ